MLLFGGNLCGPEGLWLRAPKNPVAQLRLSRAILRDRASGRGEASMLFTLVFDGLRRLGPKMPYVAGTPRMPRGYARPYGAYRAQPRLMHTDGGGGRN